MSLVRVHAPASFFRISRHDPLQWPDWRYVGDSRFDDPNKQFRVLYTGSRRACFVESLAAFRSGLTDIDTSGVIPDEWFATRNIAELRTVNPGWRGLDLRRSGTIQTVRRALAASLAAAGSLDFDLSHAVGSDIRVTQAVSRWANDHGYDGLVYASRFGTELECVAIFEPTVVEAVGVHAIEHDDPDLGWAISLLGLSK